MEESVNSKECILTTCTVHENPRKLSEDDEKKLLLQDSRGLLSKFQQEKLESNAAVNWDKFYKRNETR